MNCRKVTNLVYKFWKCGVALVRLEYFILKLKELDLKLVIAIICYAIYIYIYTTLLLNKQFMKTLSYIKFNDAEFFWKYFSYEN